VFFDEGAVSWWKVCKNVRWDTVWILPLDHSRIRSHGSVGAKSVHYVNGHRGFGVRSFVRIIGGEDSSHVDFYQEFEMSDFFGCRLMMVVGVS